MIEIDTTKPYTIFADVLEQGALDQFSSALNEPFAVKGALMPDAHTGYSLPIGAVVATEGVIVPAWVGYDIGCGMCAVPTTFKVEDVRANDQAIFDSIYKSVPVGFSHNPTDTHWPGSDMLPRSNVLNTFFNKNGLKQLGSLGSGNHFIEIGSDGYGKVWIVVHSGSRGLGHSVASHYMALASGTVKPKEGHFALSVDSEEGKSYIQDLNFCLEFALANRREIVRRVELALFEFCTGSVSWTDLINRNHNHAILDDGLWIHRKGATHAEEGMAGVIPGNMRDGSFIVVGKGNADSLKSSSHGAGRVLGRKEAERILDPSEFKATMKGIMAKSTPEFIDESPFAYKDIFQVMAQQSELVTVVSHVRPLINIKG